MIRTLTITYHAAPNLGAFLQTYALHKTLNKMPDVEDVVLDYQSHKQIAFHKNEIYGKTRGIRSTIVYYWGMTHWRDVKIRSLLFQKQRLSNLHLSGLCTTWKEIRALIDKNHYNVLISGSDQIWNCELADYSPVYYFPRLRHKISYGSSLGLQISKSSLETVKRYANEYSYIASREAEAAELLTDITGKNVPVILDPSLLLHREDYMPLAKDYVNQKRIGQYILFYSVTCDPSVIKKAKDLSKQFGIPVIAVYNGGVFRRAARERINGFKVDFKTDPGKFIWYIMNAEMVLTDSYHGNALSILFHKNFLRIQEVHGDSPQKDDRIDTLLSSLALEDRTVSILSGYMPQKKINWDLVDKRLDEMRTKSIEWLSHAVHSTAMEDR